MRALTVRQPWAWAIIHGGKTIENRIRNVAGSYRGPVAIHAGLTEDDDAYADDMIRAAFAEYDDSWKLLDEMITGAIIGVVDLVDVHQPVAVPPYCCDSWWRQIDPHIGAHLVLANPRPLSRPVPARGQLGLWRMEPETWLKVDAQLWADEIKAGSR